MPPVLRALGALSLLAVLSCGGEEDGGGGDTSACPDTIDIAASSLVPDCRTGGCADGTTVEYVVEFLRPVAAPGVCEARGSFACSAIVPDENVVAVTASAENEWRATVQWSCTAAETDCRAGMSWTAPLGGTITRVIQDLTCTP